MFVKRLALSLVAVFAILYMAGCGGSVAAIGVAVSATASTVDGGNTTTLTATVTNDVNSAGVTWSTSAGTLSNQTTTGATITLPAAAASAQSVIVTATSVHDATKTGTATITVPAQLAVTTTSTNLAGAVGTPYSVTLAASGGIPPYKWALAGGTLPNCLQLSSAGVLNTISGTAPTATCAGTASNLTFKVTDSGTATPLTFTSSALSITITAPTLTFPSSLTGGTVGTLYSASAAANGALGATAYSIASGSLPASGNLTLNASTGLISGTPHAADVGTSNFTVKAVDAYGDTATSGPLSITIAAAPAITMPNAAAPATATAGVAYSGTVAATGGVLPLTYSITAGSLSPLTLNTSTGAITGTATAVGTLNFTVQAADNFGDTPASKAYSITVNPGAATHFAVAATSSTTITAGGTVGYSVTALDSNGNTATGYTGTVHFTSSDGQAALPANATLTNGAGTFSATLKTAGAQTITATDTVSSSITGTLSGITVNAGTASKLVVAAPANATNNVAINFTVTAEDQYGNTATGFADSVHFTSTDGSAVLPSNSTLTNGSQQFSATLKTNGNQTITATDVSNGAINGTSGSINVSTALIVTTSSLNPLDVSQTPTQVMGASGGSGITADYSWSWTATSGSLPPGLTMGTNGAIGGSPTTAGTYYVTVKVQDSGTSTSNTANLSIIIYGALSLPTPNPSSLPSGYTGVAYTGSVTGTGGNSPSMSITSALAPSNGTLAAGVTGAQLNVSGTATTATTESVTVKLTDATTGNSTPATTYTILFSAPPTPTLPAATGSTPGAGTVGQGYTGAITVSNSIGPNYTWTVNGSPLTNGTPVSIGDGLSVSTTGNGTLSITGTPTSVSTSPGVQFTAQVKDLASGVSSTSTQYTIVVNSSGSQVSGAISLQNYCGLSSLPTFNVSINYPSSGSPTVVNTDNNGNYSFSSIPNGTYTVTPSITGAASSVFYPATYSVTVNNGNISGDNFTASLGYNVSGSVSYNSSTGSPSGAQSGQVYLYLNGCGSQLGTSISEATLTGGGAFTIHGVPPGSNYTLVAIMDPLGEGAFNATDPTGSTGSIAVSYANVTGAAVTMTNPTVAVPNSYPGINGIIPNPNGVLISFQPSTNSNGTEDATSYVVQWSTSPTLGSGSNAGQFSTSPVSHTFAANGTGSNVWILNNSTAGAGTFTSGQTYYFQARSVNAAGHSTAWCNYLSGSSNNCGGTSGSFTGVTIGTPTCSGCSSVSGTVTIPSGVTLGANAQLYMGYYNNNTGNIVATQVSGTPVVGGSGNSFSLQVPNGSGWSQFGILDQNNNGLIDAGDVTNVRNNSLSQITISGTLTGQALTLPAVGSNAVVQTQYWKDVESNGSGGSNTYTGYDLRLGVNEDNKLPVSVQLTSGPNINAPIDIPACTTCGNLQYQYSFDLPSGTPSIGDTYDFTVTYSDGSQDTGSTVNGAVTQFGSTGAVVGPSDLATLTSPTGSTSNLQPGFVWTDPSNASNYYYSFYLNQNSGTCPSSGCQIWSVPGENSNSNGMSSSVTSLLWNVDPISGDNSTTSVTSLTGGVTYGWGITVQDTSSSQNQAQSSTYFIP